MRTVFLSTLLFAFMLNVSAQMKVKLWDGEPLTKIEEADMKLTGGEPEMTIYLPDAANNKKKALIVCPGGGYARLAMEHEGSQVAEWLKEQGYTAVVLKYRLPAKKYKQIPLEDTQQAFRYVRSKAKEWNIEKVGVAGFSAGGHLASTVSTHFKDDKTRPDFSVLYYPVITMDERYTHAGSRLNLIGDKPSQTDLYVYSNDKQVNAQTPPAIIFLSDDDRGVVPHNSILYYEALKKNNVPASMYIFPTGGHGWGMKDNFKYKEEMLTLLKMWLDSI